MAGFYPDAPGRRMALDSDGSVFLWALQSGAGQIQEFNDLNKAIVTSESEDTTNVFGQSSANRYLWWIFPELREVDGTFYAYSSSGDGGRPGALHSSPDTTNGRDGTWTQQHADLPDFSIVMGNYRSGITSLAINAVRGLRVASLSGGFNHDIKAWHVYGEISPGETPDRLLFIDEATGLEFDLPKDFGDVPRGSAREWQFRLKNNSTAAGNNLTINTIQFTAESLYLNSGAWYTFSVGGDPFAATKQIASLAPEAESPLITGRQIIPVNEVLGLHAARIRVTHTSLS